MGQVNFYEYQKEAIRAAWRAKEPSLIVAPTGSGKSYIIAGIARLWIEKTPNTRILILSHRKEILVQNANKLRKLLPNTPIGVYSSGLKLKQLAYKITVAGIQSIYKKDLVQYGLIIIDECHLIPRASDSMYQKLLKNQRSAQVLGLTATPFRLDHGSLLAEGGTFKEICYDISLRKLIEEGYLSSVTSKAREEVDTSQVSKSGYDYNQKELIQAFDKIPLIEKQAREIIELGKDRKHWLIFCAGIAPAMHFCEKLQELGISASWVDSNMLDMERDRRIREFTEGKFQALCNCQILTTGFDFPGIDLVVLLRVTQSAALYMQMVGRGMRTSEGKKDCLILDYGGNILRHGPIDLIEVQNKKEKLKSELIVAPTKACKVCGCVVAVAVRKCPSCDTPFPLVSLLEKKAETREVLAVPETLVVSSTTMKLYKKEDKPSMMRIEYVCGINTYINDFLCFNHGLFAREYAIKKWHRYGGALPPPRTSEEALQRTHELRQVKSLRVIKKGKYYEILGVEFQSEKELEEMGL